VTVHDSNLNVWRCQFRIAELLPEGSETTRGRVLARLQNESRQWHCESQTEYDAIAATRIEQLCLNPAPSIAEQNQAIRRRNQRVKDYFYPLLPPGELEQEIPEPVLTRPIAALPERPANIPINIDEQHRKLLDEWITNGIRKVLPAKLRHAAMQIKDDIRQKVWEHLLEMESLYVNGEPNTKAAYNWARRLSTEYLRNELPTMPVSQMDLTQEDGGENGEFIEATMPWDKSPAGQYADDNQDFSKEEGDERRAVLEELKAERPKDYEFIVDYKGTGNGTRSLAERQRALNIRRWLGRRKINLTGNSDLTPLAANTGMSLSKGDGTVKPAEGLAGQ
jgi:hypothetical protein